MGNNFFHLWTAVDRFKHLAGVELTMNEDTRVTLFDEKINYLFAFFIPEDLEDFENFFFEASHISDFLIKNVQVSRVLWAPHGSVFEVG